MQCHVSTANLPASQPIQTSSKQLPEMHPFVGALATLFCMKGCCLAVSELCLWCCACRHTNATSCFSGEDPNCNPNLCCCIKVEVVHVTSQAIRRSLPVMSGVDFERLLVITAWLLTDGNETSANNDEDAITCAQHRVFVRFSQWDV